MSTLDLLRTIKEMRANNDLLEKEIKETKNEVCLISKNIDIGLNGLANGVYALSDDVKTHVLKVEKNASRCQVKSRQNFLQSLKTSSKSGQGCKR